MLLACRGQLKNTRMHSTFWQEFITLEAWKDNDFGKERTRNSAGSRTGCWVLRKTLPDDSRSARTKSQLNEADAKMSGSTQHQIRRNSC